MKLKDRVAIVTGAARGLGRAFCAALSEEGAKVVAVDIAEVSDTLKEIDSLGATAIGLKVDVSSERDTLKMAGDTLKAFGRIDILVNNAAIIYGLLRKPFFEIDPDLWDKVMAVNVKGPWLCTKAVFPQMKAQGKGKIITLSSETFFTGSHGFVHYVASKGGVVGLTRALAVELGPHNITINAIAPGFTDTEASRSIADVTKYDVSRTPLNRLQQPKDLLGALIFLASDDSDFITGQVLLVDGGRVMH
jgi:NAD(P)-dependent dehydrogenase (short-subunit alcohol dehydrogenase family)